MRYFSASSGDHNSFILSIRSLCKSIRCWVLAIAPSRISSALIRDPRTADRSEWVGVKFDPVEDIDSALEPLSAQIAAVEENIESIVRRNDVVDEEIKGMKTDIQSLSEKILAIKVSTWFFVRYFSSCCSLKCFVEMVLSFSVLPA